MTFPKQPETNPKTAPSFRSALTFWLKLGLISFGGPAAQIAVMHRELVETKRWMDDRHFFNGLNFCILLPGPEAQQLATYLGWRLHGAKGGIAAGALFVLPSALILFALSWLYVAGSSKPWVGAIFHGLSGAVIAIVLDALLRIGSKSLRTRSLAALAIAAFVAMYFFEVGFVLIILVAALVGLGGHKFLPGQFPAGKAHGPHPDGHSLTAIELPPVPAPTWGRAAKVLAICLALWWLPVVALGLWLGWQSTPAQQGLFFSKAAVVTFGGAYAVLPYVAQQAVENFGWLTNTQMMAGLALAETTPGPLIMVLQFVGFVGGWQNPGAFPPLASAALCAGITTWVTFLPGFLFVFLGAPWIEKIASFPKLASALSAITACVTGVILKLAVVFSTAALWPEGGRFDYFVLAVAVLAFAALNVWRIPLVVVIAFAALAGWIHSTIQF